MRTTKIHHWALRRFLFKPLMTAILPAGLIAGTPSRFHDFAQIADGGGYRTIFLVLNQNDQSVDITVKFFKDDGTPLALTVDGISGSVLTASIPAGGTRKMVTAGTASGAQVGWAQLTATGEVGAQILFEFSSSGQLVTQAAVESPGPVDNFDVFFDQSSTSGTGVALANLSESGSIAVRLTLKDQSGTVLATKDLTLVARGHVARFINEIFPGTTGRGSLHIESSGPVSAITLQVTGLVIGTQPVISVSL
ncbi:MAG TPA: hypothetical protein VGL91_12325 [Acidobacteriota bacterium]|jgi:hypothetical protein